MGRYRAIERVTGQTDEGHTYRVEVNETTDDEQMVAHSPESFEDTQADLSEDDKRAAEVRNAQVGVDAEGGIIGVAKPDLSEEKWASGGGMFASSRLTRDGNADRKTTGAEVGTPEDAQDSVKFAEGAQQATDYMAEQQDKRTAEISEAVAGQNAPQPVLTTTSPAKAGAPAKGA